MTVSLPNSLGPTIQNKLVVLSDMQIPHHDRVTLGVVHRFLRNFQPDDLILNGDIADFAALSTYRLTLAQRESLSDEVFLLRLELSTLRNILPNTRIRYILGNHEERLAHYITDHAPELEWLADGPLSLEALAKTGELGIEVVAPYGESVDWYGLMVTHGTIIRDNTAKANLIREGSSGVSGHTHRLSSYYKTDRSGTHAWYEGGCLCNLEGPHRPPPAHPGVVDWQQGFVVAYATGERAWTVYQVPIVGHRFIWNGAVYAPAS